MYITARQHKEFMPDSSVYKIRKKNAPVFAAIITKLFVRIYSRRITNLNNGEAKGK